MCQYEEMKDKKGQIVHGIVKRVEAGNLVVEIGHSEALLRRDELIPRELYRVGDRIRALVLDVRQEVKGPHIFLKRSNPDFVAALFKAEVPEVYDGTIEIKSVSRDAGSRSKIAVYSEDSTIDARGACIGMRGIRVQAVCTELQGEKIDVVNWSADPATFIINALAPNEVLKIVIDEEAKNDIIDNDNFEIFNGALYESLVSEALIKSGYDLYFYKSEDATIELDFIIRVKNNIVPIEVKKERGRNL